MSYHVSCVTYEVVTLCWCRDPPARRQVLGRGHLQRDQGGRQVAPVLYTPLTSHYLPLPSHYLPLQVRRVRGHRRVRPRLQQELLPARDPGRGVREAGGAVQYITAKYSTVQYSIVQYSTV